MASRTLFMGLLKEVPIEMGPMGFGFDGGHGVLIVLDHQARLSLKQFEGTHVRIAIEEIWPLKKSLEPPTEEKVQM